MIQGGVDADMFADFEGERDKGERSSCSRICFGLLMSGFGLKKQLLEDFASTTLSDFTVIVINGYLPSINLTHPRSRPTPRDADKGQPRPTPRDEDSGVSTGTSSLWATGVAEGRTGTTSADGPQESSGYAEQPPPTDTPSRTPFTQPLRPGLEEWRARRRGS
jgi:hypothetical protein